MGPARRWEPLDTKVGILFTNESTYFGYIAIHKELLIFGTVASNI